MGSKMSDRMRSSMRLTASALLLSLSACGTEEVAPPAQIYLGTTSGPGQGAFIITFPPGAATYDEELAWGMSPAPQYALVVDGALARTSAGPIVIGEGSEMGIGFLPGGQHHFALAAPAEAPIFEADGEIVAGAQNRLYLFGPHGAVQGRFVSYPSQPAPGTLHVSAVNLIQGGATVEVVSCTSDTACTSLSPPLALGDAFEADFPAAALDKEPYYTLAGGATLGLRQVPTAAVPIPPAMQLETGFVQLDPAAAPDPAAIMVIAPVYIANTGNFILSFS